MDGTKVSQVSQINCGSFGPNQFTDLLMSNLVFSKIGDMFKDSFSLNPTNIMKLIFLMSVNELRGSFGELIRLLISKLKDSPGALYSLASYLLSIRKFPLISRRQIPYEPTVFKRYTYIENISHKTYCVEISFNVLNLLGHI